MTMFDAKSRSKSVNAIAPQTITGSAIVSGNLDLAGFNGAKIAVLPGTVDGLNGGSPTPGTIAVKLEHADDDGAGAPGAFADVALTDVLGPASVSAGVVTTLSESNGGVQEIGYVGDKQWLRLTLTPSGLGAGGPVAAALEKHLPRHGPAA